MHPPRDVVLMTFALVFGVPAVGRGDDDEGNPSIPPVKPGGGYGHIFPNPTPPPNYVQHSGSSPSGVGSIANTQADSLRLGQSFEAAATALDWVAMVFQYNYQPNTGPMEPAQFRIHVANGIVTSGDNSGELINVLGSTGIESVTPDPETGDSLGWVLFDFPSTVSLTPGQQYYLRVEHVGGYGVDNTGVGVAVGSLGSNAYSEGARWRAIYNQFLDRWEQFAFRNEDLVFSLGAKLPSLPGDFNQNNAVDAADYVVWRDKLGGSEALPNDDSEGVGPDDYDRWKAEFGMTAGGGSGENSLSTVPEPTALAPGAISATCWRVRRRSAA